MRYSPAFYKTVLILMVLAAAVASPPAAAEPQPLVFGVLSTAEPSRVYPKWQPLADYIAGKIGQPVKIIVPRGFDKMTEAIDKGEVDFFYINSYVLYRLKEKDKVVPLAQMQNHYGGPFSRSVVIVRRDSGIKSLDQLKGEKVAFVSPMGAGGYVAPRALFYSQGIYTKDVLKEEFTKNLTTSLHKVLLGDVKAASMCGLNYKLLSEKIETGELAIIATSDEYAEHAFGARPGLSPELQKAVAKTLIELDQDEAGRKILADLHDQKVQKFVAYDAEKTESVTRRLAEQARMQ